MGSLLAEGERRWQVHGSDRCDLRRLGHPLEERVEHPHPVELQRVGRARYRQPARSSADMVSARSSAAAMAAGTSTGTISAVSPTASPMPPVSRGDDRAAAGEHLLDQRDAERLDELRPRLARQHERRAARPSEWAFSSSSTSSRNTIRSAAGEAAATSCRSSASRAVAGDDQLQARRQAAAGGEAGDQVVDALGVGEPGEEQHVAVGASGRAARARSVDLPGRGPGSRPC